MSTIQDVAELAGVSKATVSRVLSGTTLVKEITRQKVLAAVAQLEYSPNQAARSLASKRSFTIGLVLFDINSAYYGPSASAVEAALRGEDRHVIIASGQSCVAGEREAVEFLIKRQVDALVLITNFLSAEELAEIDQRCPVFVLNQSYPNCDGKTILFDNYLGGWLATEYLIQQGHRKIATITGPLRKNDAYQRLQGYHDALQHYGLASQWQAEGNFYVDSGVALTRILLEQSDRPTALVCGNDLMALGAMRVCHEYNITIPQQMAIVGFDDFDLAQYFTPTLTTIKMPLFAMADALAKLLLHRIYQKKQPPSTVFKPELIVRQSA